MAADRQTPGATPPPAERLRAEIDRRLRETPMGLTVQAATEAAMGVVRPLLNAWAARVDELETAWERVRPGHHPDLERALRDPDGPCQECIRILFADLTRERDALREQARAAEARALKAETVNQILAHGVTRGEAERDRLAKELEDSRANLGAALSVTTLGEARAEIIGLRTELETLQLGAAEARRADDERHTEVTRERDRLAEQVAAVRAVHPRRDDPSGPVCGACLDAYEEPVDWPCPTIRALDGPAGGEGQ